MICLLDSYLKARSPTETIAVCLVASATAKCAQVIVTRLYRTPHHPTYPLAHTLAQLVAVPSAIRYIVPYVLWQWNALGLHPNKLLDNPALCHAYPNKCRQAAYAVLQLNETAGPRDIREAYRRWVKQWHPDLPSGDGVAFRRGQAAKDLLSAT
ncbi:MAG: J domain-containing protein [Verrucomicrobia bacterium]|nr:J domain-containing protein [Verrucomicrobiota bacterium]